MRQCFLKDNTLEQLIAIPKETFSMVEGECQTKKGYKPPGS